MAPALHKVDPRVRLFHARRFSLRTGDEPEPSRASGDSGFVAHLSASTRGATGWDWSFRLVKRTGEWAFVTDGQLSVFVDEPGQYVPHEARPGEQVALRLPRARENLFPHRFTLNGGQGPVVVGTGFTKFFLPLVYEAAGPMVEAMSSRLGDQLRFSLYLANAQSDYQRADAAVLDVGPADSAGVLRLLDSFLHAHPRAVVQRGLPHGTRRGALGLAVGEGVGRADLADGFGWRLSQEAVSSGLV